MPLAPVCNEIAPHLPFMEQVKKIDAWCRRVNRAMGGVPYAPIAKEYEKFKVDRVQITQDLKVLADTKGLRIEFPPAAD